MKSKLLFSAIIGLLMIALILGNLSFSVNPYKIDLVYAGQNNDNQNNDSQGNGGGGSYSRTAKVPEPSTLLLAGMGIAGIFGFGVVRKKFKK